MAARLRVMENHARRSAGYSQCDRIPPRADGRDRAAAHLLQRAGAGGRRPVQDHSGRRAGWRHQTTLTRSAARPLSALPVFHFMSHRPSAERPVLHMHSPSTPSRRLPIGAEPQPDGGGVHFRVWAPGRRRVVVVIDGRATPLAAEPIVDQTGEAAGTPGYFSGLVPEARAGTRYQFRLDDEELLLPDPASRWQPDGPHGPSV